MTEFRPAFHLASPLCEDRWWMLKWLKSRAGFLLVPVAASGAGVALSWPLFEPGLPLSGDNPTHLAEILALRDLILPEQQWWSGWFEGDFAGYPLMAYQYVLGKLLVLLLSGLSGIPVGTAYKLVMIGSWLFPILVALRLFSRAAGMLAGALTGLLLLINLDLLYLALGGMWNQFLAAGFFLLALDSLVSLEERFSGRRLVGASIWIALGLLSHQFMMILAPAVWAAACMLLAGRTPPKRARLISLGWVPVLSCLLAAWYILPAIQTYNWPQLQADRIAFDPYPFLFPLVLSGLAEVGGWGELLRSDLVRLSAGMILALLLGIPGYLLILRQWLKGRPLGALYRFGLLFAACLTLVLAGVINELLPVVGRAGPFVLAGRFAPYILITMLFGVAYLCEGFLLKRRWGKILAILLVLLASARLGSAIGGEAYKPEFFLLYPEEGARKGSLADLQAVWEWLGQSAEAREGRVFCQDTLFNLKSDPLYWSHPFALTPHKTGLWVIGAFSEGNAPLARWTKSEAGRFLNRNLRDLSASEVVRGLELLNCPTVVVCEEEMRLRLAESGRFEEMFRSGPFRIFQSPGGFGWVEWVAGSGKYQIEQWSLDRRMIRVEVGDATGARMRVKSGAHPWWRISINGRPAEPVGREPLDMIVLDLPVGISRIEMRFEPPIVLPVVLTLVGIGLAALLYLRR